MLPLGTLLLFAACTAGLALTPGPNVALIVSRTLANGSRGGAFVLIGVESAFAVHLLSAVGGLSAILLAVPVVFDALRWIGAAYLLYLAFRAVANSGGSTVLALPADPGAAKSLVWAGFMSNALNPKTAMFYLAVFPQFLNPKAGSVIVPALELGAVHLLTSTLCNLAYVLLVARLGPRVHASASMSRISGWMSGSVLAAFAVRLILSRRPVAP